MNGAVWRLTTPAGAGAVAVVQVSGTAAEVEGVLERLELGAVRVGGLGLRELRGVDTLLVARPAAGVVQLMPHGGGAVVRGVLERLGGAGVAEARVRDVRAVYPEATDRLEAEMLDALARAASPRAVDVLLGQPELWRAANPGLDAWALPAGRATGRDRELARLVEAPLVVAVGGANIGKSTLCNALARREVSIVADEPGTTRDHVGVLIEVDGLVVRYVDTPGIREGGDLIEAEAQRLAAEVVRSADLVLLCGDPATPPPLPPPLPPPPPLLRSVTVERSTLRVCLRADLGVAAWGGSALRVSVREGSGVEALARGIREALVPGLEDEGGVGLWRYWPEEGCGAGCGEVCGGGTRV